MRRLILAGALAAADSMLFLAAPAPVTFADVTRSSSRRLETAAGAETP